MTLSQAMAAKSARGQGIPPQAPVAGAAMKQQPTAVSAVQPAPGTTVPSPPEANRGAMGGGMNMQQAMGGKGAKQGPPPSQPLQQPMGGMTLQQATGGKVGIHGTLTTLDMNQEIQVCRNGWW